MRKNPNKVKMREYERLTGRAAEAVIGGRYCMTDDFKKWAKIEEYADKDKGMGNNRA